MEALRFEWDIRKNATNRFKNGISFEEAETVFADENALLLDDPDHSETEDRFVLIGLSVSFRMLVVVHCYRADGGLIRIIPARKATRSEQRYYDQRWKL